MGRPDLRRALQALEALAGQLERTYPGAADSLREGMADTLAVTRLGLRGELEQTMASTKPVRVEDRDRAPDAAQRKALRSGEMRLRWTAAGMLEAERQFRRVRATASRPFCAPPSAMK